MAKSRNETVLLLVAGLVFLMNTGLFGWYFDEDRQGFEDALRAIDQYQSLLLKVGNWNQLDLQSMAGIKLFQVLVTLLIVGCLLATSSLTIQAATLYLAWPYAAYLAIKVKQEFILFPLAFIRLGLGWKQELLVSVPILLVFLVFRENNALILLGFRWLALIYARLTWKVVASLSALLIISGLLIDVQFDRVASIVPLISKFNYTRNIVNPEYSVVESFGVLIASFHLGINPPKDWWFHIPFSLAAIGIGFLHWLKARPTQAADTEWKKGLTAFFVVYLFCTSLTHAFQNTRYYFFVVPLMLPDLRSWEKVVLLGLSLAHTVAAVLIYEFVYR